MNTLYVQPETEKYVDLIGRVDSTMPAAADGQGVYDGGKSKRNFKLVVPSICNSMLIKIQPDATVCRYLFTAKLLYMFRVSQHQLSGILKTVTAVSGTGHNIGTATSLQRDLIRTDWCCDTRNM